MSTQCPKCKAENPDESKFCNECGLQIDPVDHISAPTQTIKIPKEGLKPGAIFADRYQIEEEIGKGGMGTVYRGLDKKLNEEVALKIIKPEIAADEMTIERFRNELKLARKITHKNVCRMFDFHEEEGIPYITMEYIEGVSLRDFILREERLSEEQTIEIARQLCRGLSEAHSMGVVHRDLKPQNIMIDPKDNAKIMDFGIARSVEALGVTQSGVLIGTPVYMSPEQVEGKEADHTSDIYSLGVILFEMVTGRLPFEGDTALSIALKHKTEAPVDPREINDSLSENMSGIILRCLEKDKELRFQNVDTLLTELRSIKDGMPTTTTVATPDLPAFLADDEEGGKEELPVFVARENELAKMESFLEKALSGKGQIIFVEGEAGSGKTALIQEFARCSQEAHPDLIVASGKCNAHTGIGDPYLPFIEVLGFLTGDVEAKWSAGIITREHAQRLWNLLPLTSEAIVNQGPDLINTFVPGAELVRRGESFSSSRAAWLYPLKKLVENKTNLPADVMLQQSYLFEQFMRVLEVLAKQKPLLLVLDDLQWMDAGSANLLFHLGRRIKGSRIKIIGSFRPSEIDMGRAGDRHPLEPILNEFKRDYGDIEINVDKVEGRAFIDAFLDTEANNLGSSFRDMLFKQTKGHPLFTVELLRDMQDQGVLIKISEGQWAEGPELNWDALPARVDAVIEERINRLSGHLRDILTLASVEGEEFTAEVVARLQDTEVRELIRHLSHELDKRHHLVSAKGIHRIDKQRLSRYLFQHILFQRFLYNNLDKVERAHLHGEIGEILELLYGDSADEIASQLARHFNEAGDVEKAIEYFYKAGDKAAKVSANLEAIQHFKQALDLIKTLPESIDRNKQELSLQLALILPIQATQGFASPEIGQAVKRAQELYPEFGDTPEVFMALTQISTYYSTRPEYRKALEFEDQITQLAEKLGDPMMKAISHYNASWSKLNLGELTQSLEHTKHMSEFYDPEKHGYLAYAFGYDLGVISLAFGAWSLWFLGYPDQAKEQMKTAIAHAKKIDHPHTLAFALVGGIAMQWFLRNRTGIDKYTDELVPISYDNGFLFWIGHAQIYLGERKTLAGQTKEGIAEMKEGVATLHMTGSETCLTRLMARMVAACKEMGEVEEGLKFVDEALELKCKFEEVYMEAELHRLKGELLQLRGEEEQSVENYFRKAIDIARSQEAKSFELRAAMSLSRLLNKQNKKEEAKELLEDVYNWFTEGFDTADLKEAKALLEKLSD
jgi:tetratricopeptide (TPR) repeat protein/predicted Ser/Thr protein kinase